MRIAFDVFGGDNCPNASLDGCIQFMARHADEPDLNVLLFGDENIIAGYLQENGFSDTRVKVIHAPTVVDCHDQPTMAVRQKRDSSMMMALQSVADGEAECVVSSGNTGALLSGAMFIVKRIRGIKRAALAPVLPTVKGTKLVLLDAGANADCKPEFLVQFARMGKQYVSAGLGVENPRVGLLSNGAEETKGNELVIEAHKLLKDTPGIDFIGNVEANEVLNGDIDLLVCDGFSGNVLLKSLEGAIRSLMRVIKAELLRTKRSKIGGALIRPSMRSIMSMFDPSETGGGLLLGVDGGVVKAHGNSDAKAFSNALERAYSFTQAGVVQKIKEEIQNDPLNEE